MAATTCYRGAIRCTAALRAAGLQYLADGTGRISRKAAWLDRGRHRPQDDLPPGPRSANHRKLMAVKSMPERSLSFVFGTYHVNRDGLRQRAGTLVAARTESPTEALSFDLHQRWKQCLQEPRPGEDWKI